jgi:hypothetical protein
MEEFTNIIVTPDQEAAWKVEREKRLNGDTGSLGSFRPQLSLEMQLGKSEYAKFLAKYNLR